MVATYDAASSTNLSISDKTLTVNPSEKLETDTTYQLVFDEGAIVDLNDKKYKQVGDYQFTTNDNTAQTATSISPTDDDTATATESA